VTGVQTCALPISLMPKLADLTVTKSSMYMTESVPAT
jgi:hypothetical protein